MSDSSHGCLGRWRSRSPARFSNRRWRFGTASRRTWLRHSEFSITEPNATGLRAVANITPRWRAINQRTRCAVLRRWNMRGVSHEPALRQKFVVGNWKMYTNAAEARQLAKAVVDGMGAEERVSVTLCPPFPIWPLSGKFSKAAASRLERRTSIRKRRRVHRRGQSDDAP